MFRDLNAKGKGKAPPVMVSGDVEDLISVPFYLKLFNATFKKQLSGNDLTEANIPPGDRIVDRINRHLEATGISIRPSGGYNHYAVANHLAANPPKTVDKDTLNRFEAAFKAVNALFSEVA